MLRVKRADLRARGVERVLDRVTGVQDGRPVLAGGRLLTDVANVVWCTGFRQVFDWIDLPIFGADGWPREMRGVVPEAPGLFFCGLAFQYAFSSMVLAGVGRDAAYVARADRRTGRRSRTHSQPEACWRVTSEPGGCANGRRAGQDHRPVAAGSRGIRSSRLGAGLRPAAQGRRPRPEDTMALATAAVLTGDADEAVRALQAGYQDRIRNSDALGAARFAFWLGFVLNIRGEMAVGGGWVARAERLLETEPEDIVERGYLLIHEFFQHLGRGDFARAERDSRAGRSRSVAASPTKI